MRLRFLFLILGVIASMLSVAAPATAIAPDAPAHRKATPPISLSGPTTGVQGRTAKLVGKAVRVNSTALTYLQQRVGDRWVNIVDPCTFDEPNNTKTWYVTLPKSSSVKYRVRSVYKGTAYLSNVKTITLSPETSTPSDPTAPISSADVRTAIDAMAKAINDDRAAAGYSRLPVDYTLSSDVQAKTVKYYSSGSAPDTGTAVMALWGTKDGTAAPSVAGPAFHGTATKLALGFYYDQNKSFDGRTAAFVVVMY